MNLHVLMHILFLFHCFDIIIIRVCVIIQCEVQGSTYDINRVCPQFYTLSKLWKDVKEVCSGKNLCEWGCVIFEARTPGGTQKKPVHTDEELQSLFEYADSKGVSHVRFYLMQSEPQSLAHDNIIHNQFVMDLAGKQDHILGYLDDANEPREVENNQVDPIDKEIVLMLANRETDLDEIKQLI